MDKMIDLLQNYVQFQSMLQDQKQLKHHNFHTLKLFHTITNIRKFDLTRQ